MRRGQGNAGDSSAAAGYGAGEFVTRYEDLPTYCPDAASDERGAILPPVQRSSLSLDGKQAPSAEGYTNRTINSEISTANRVLYNLFNCWDSHERLLACHPFLHQYPLDRYLETLFHHFRVNKNAYEQEMKRQAARIHACDRVAIPDFQYQILRGNFRDDKFMAGCTRIVMMDYDCTLHNPYAKPGDAQLTPTRLKALDAELQEKGILMIVCTARTLNVGKIIDPFDVELELPGRVLYTANMVPKGYFCARLRHELGVDVLLVDDNTLEFDTCHHREQLVIQVPLDLEGMWSTEGRVNWIKDQVTERFDELTQSQVIDGTGIVKVGSLSADVLLARGEQNGGMGVAEEVEPLADTLARGRRGRVLAPCRPPRGVRRGSGSPRSRAGAQGSRGIFAAGGGLPVIDELRRLEREQLPPVAGRSGAASITPINLREVDSPKAL